jgi:hypothetical protein
MITTLLDLNPAQKQIYSLSNIKRAFPDFDDLDTNGIYLKNESLIIVYKDGHEKKLPKQNVIVAYQQFTSRVKDFFAYLGPNYRGPSLWRNNSYIILKGWHYQHQLAKNTNQAFLQREWIDKFIHLKTPEKLLALLQSDHTDLGHLISPDGLYVDTDKVLLDSEFIEEEESVKPSKTPHCSCGSFQRQLTNLADFQQEIAGYQPICIHLTWFQQYRNFLVKRTEVREQNRGVTPEKACAWYYAPPENNTSNGKFLVLYTKHGATAAANYWHTYKPQEHFTAKDVWPLFNSMLEAGFVPFNGVSLPQLKNYLKNS